MARRHNSQETRTREEWIELREYYRARYNDYLVEHGQPGLNMAFQCNDSDKRGTSEGKHDGVASQ